MRTSKPENIENTDIDQSSILTSDLVSSQFKQNTVDQMASSNAKSANSRLKVESEQDVSQLILINSRKSSKCFGLNLTKHQPAEMINEIIKSSRNLFKPNMNQVPIEVESRIVILKVGQIDTRNERFDAEAYIECSWNDDDILKQLIETSMSTLISTSCGISKNNSHEQDSTQNLIDQENYISPIQTTALVPLTTEQQTNMSNLKLLKHIVKNISTFDYDVNAFWSPQLYIENAIGDIKEEIRYKLEIAEKKKSDQQEPQAFNVGDLRKSTSNLTIRVCEMRKLRGVFYEVMRCRLKAVSQSVYKLFAFSFQAARTVRLPYGHPRTYNYIDIKTQCARSVHYRKFGKPV
jgi:hypothetical protein